jgi:hypothetical protein
MTWKNEDLPSAMRPFSIAVCARLERYCEVGFWEVIAIAVDHGQIARNSVLS